ncbi:hypothetical protein ACTS9V_15565 [Empedobacter falsenii]
MEEAKEKRKLEINERPRICCIDIDEEVVKYLCDSGFNLYSGTLGDKVKVPNKKRHENHQLLLNYDFPENIHEYDIFLIDLNNSKTIDYNSKDHIRENHTGKKAISLLSSYPETIFDPRPLSSVILEKKLKQIGSRTHMIITFTTESYEIEYETVLITEDSVSRHGYEKHHIYSYIGNVPLSESKYGKEMIVEDVRQDLKNMLEKSLNDSIYNQTFHHPTTWSNESQIPSIKYKPLIRNSNNDIVSFIETRDNAILFYFPQINEKKEFLYDFLTKLAPDLMPDLFPFSTKFSWKQNYDYWLPNHNQLLNERELIKNEYKAKISAKNKEIKSNTKKYSFLHDILSESGDELVKALEKYLKWLGFENIINVDEQKTENTVLEEDIQIELDNGLLIIECKGIGGTSTDSDCSQISKIKHRRCKERNSFDVYALYIVNHQRYLPPINRRNPPFTENQIQDAVNDERGLLTTWQLFNLYEEIENGLIDKSKARQELLKYGHVEIKPNLQVIIDEPKEFFKDGHICIVNINVELKIGEEILIEKNGKFISATIEGIQVEGKPVSSVYSGEVGLQLSKPIKRKSILWKKANN